MPSHPWGSPVSFATEQTMSYVPERPVSVPVQSPPHVLVVGGAGYIGSILTRRLLGDGHRVRVLDALLYGGDAVAPLLADPAFELRLGDIVILLQLIRRSTESTSSYISAAGW